MKRRARTKREPTTALINIVFLILIFFMVAGSLNTPSDPSLNFIQTEGLEEHTPPNALFISQSGALSLEGEPVADLMNYTASLTGLDKTARLAPDRDLPAHELLRIVGTLQDNGVSRIVVITETSS